MLKKILLILTAAGVILLTACGSKNEKPHVEGDELIKAAMEEYTSLDSATLEISDEETGKIVSRFDFIYNGNLQTYLIEGSVGNEKYIEYNNGKKLWINNGDKTRTYGRYSSDFKKYTRKKPNPNSGPGIFFFEPEYISDIDIRDTDDGKIILYSYDIQTLGDIMKLNTDTTSLLLYETEYVFDKNGKFLELFERSEVKNGEEIITSNFCIRISNKNAHTDITNPLA